MAIIDGIQPKELIQGSPLVGRTVKFTEGQVVSGRVLNITEQGAVINIAGVKILAKPSASTALQEGANITVRIEVVSENAVVLRLLEQKQERLFSLMPLDDSDIEQILLKMGVAPDTRNFTAAKALISSGVPANSTNLEMLLGLMQKFRIESPEGAKMLAFMIGKNIPISRESANLINELFSNAKLGQLLEQIRQGLSNSTDNGTLRQLLDSIDKFSSLLRLGNTSDIQAGIRTLLQNLSFDNRLLLLAQSSLSSNELNNMAAQLLESGQSILSSIDKFSLKQIGLSINTIKNANELFATLLKDSSNIDAGSLQKLLDILPQIASKISKANTEQANRLSDILFKLGLFARITTAKETGQDAMVELRNSILNAQEALKAVSASGNRQASQLNELLGRVSANINAQQLASSSIDLSQSPLNIMYIQLPFKLQNEIQTLEIAIRGDSSKNKKIDPENTSITFLLAMPVLGDLLISVIIEDGNISGRFIVDSERAKEAIDGTKNELEDNLSKTAKGSVLLSSEIRDLAAGKPAVEDILIPVDVRKMDIYA